MPLETHVSGGRMVLPVAEQGHQVPGVRLRRRCGDGPADRRTLTDVRSIGYPDSLPFFFCADGRLPLVGAGVVRDALRVSRVPDIADQEADVAFLECVQFTRGQLGSGVVGAVRSWDRRVPLGQERSGPARFSGQVHRAGSQGNAMGGQGRDESVNPACLPATEHSAGRAPLRAISASGTVRFGTARRACGTPGIGGLRRCAAP